MSDTPAPPPGRGADSINQKNVIIRQNSPRLHEHIQNQQLKSACMCSTNTEGAVCQRADGEHRPLGGAVCAKRCKARSLHRRDKSQFVAAMGGRRGF